VSVASQTTDIVYNYDCDLTGTGGLPVCSLCNLLLYLLLLEMRAKRLYLRPLYLIGLDWIEVSFAIVNN